jgi:hypothetical protein
MIHVSSEPAGTTMSLAAALPGKATSAAPRTKHKTLAFISISFRLFGFDSANSFRQEKCEMRAVFSG